MNQQLQKPVATPQSLQMGFVSVDPECDKLDILKQYTQYFNPELIGVTGKADQIDILTNQPGILYGFEDTFKEGEYVVNHSAQIILIDPAGNMHAIFSPPHTPETMAREFVAIKLS